MPHTYRGEDDRWKKDDRWKRADIQWHYSRLKGGEVGVFFLIIIRKVRWVNKIFDYWKRRTWVVIGLYYVLHHKYARPQNKVNNHS